MKTATAIGQFRYTYKTMGSDSPACNGWVFSVRADSRNEADRLAREKAASMLATARFVKVV